MEPLTPKQKKMLDFLKSFHKRKGYMPSVTEIGKHFRISSVSAWETLRRLENKEYIEKKYKQKRWIKII